MGSISVACYQPKAGREAALTGLVFGHLPPLRAEGLATDRVPIVMRAADGTIIELFEWVRQEAIAAAHANPVVLDLWKRFEAVCTYEIPSNIAEFFGTCLRTFNRTRRNRSGRNRSDRTLRFLGGRVNGRAA
jgi:hypothetical protein